MIAGMGERRIRKSKLSKHCGVSAAAATLACKPSGVLAAAFDGKFIDIDHPDAIAYLIKHTGRDNVPDALLVNPSASGPDVRPAPTVKIKAPRKPTPSKVDPSKPTPGSRDRPTGWVAKREAEKQADHARAAAVPDNIAEYADMTLRDLIDQFGTDLRFNDWLKAIKAIEDVREKRLKNAEREGELIPRDLVRIHIIAKFDAAHTTLLTDVARTIARRVASMAKADADINECERFVEETMGKTIKAAKASISRVLANA